MSDPANDLSLRRFERITAPDDGSQAASDANAEDDALREGWLAFGRLLEANDDFLEAACRARVVESVRDAGQHERRRPLALKPWQGWVALAAAALAAVAIGQVVLRDEAQLARAPTAPSRNESPESPSQSGALAGDLQVADQFAWDDALDERLWQASEQLIHAGSDWRGYDSPYSAIDWRLQDLSQTMGDERL